MNSELIAWMQTPGNYSAVKRKDRPKYSLIEEFNVASLPVHPDIGATLDITLKWMHIAIEGENFCTQCFVVNPDSPMAHHPACFAYSGLDSYPEPQQSHFGVCPQCGSDDGLSIDSCRYAEFSKIECSDCDFEFRRSCDEETLEERFRKKYKR